MINEVILKRSIVVVFSTAIFAGTGIAYAFDMCKNMFGKMNQSEWKGDYRDRDNYYRGPGVDSGYGYRGRDYGYGGPTVPSYGYAAPQTGNDALQSEIYQLKLRLKNLEKALIQETSQHQSAPTDPGTG